MSVLEQVRRRGPDPSGHAIVALPAIGGEPVRCCLRDATRRHDGRDPATAVAEVLATPGVAQVHSRNVDWGCYMFRVTRSGQLSPRGELDARTG